MNENSDAILNSWHANAEAWSNAVRDQTIESRKLVTDNAVIDAIHQHDPRTVLDLGCGEGWLTRALVDLGIDVLGVDGVPNLVDRAQSHGLRARYRTLTYDEIAAGAITETFDVVVCNFALFDAEPVERLFRAIPKLLHPDGTFIVQTLHPVTACGSHPYADGWREGSWSGCGDSFSEAPPWYFRTIESWKALIERSGLAIVDTIEPVHPLTRQPASIIFAAQARASTR